MADKVGRSFNGIISSVTNWGIYVELENTCEGMIAFRDMPDDVYNYDEDSMTCIGERTHKTYRPGDLVTVWLERVSVVAGKLDFVLYNPFSPKEKDKRRKRHGSSL